MSKADPTGGSHEAVIATVRRRGRPRVRPAIASRDRILAAALDEFAAVGYDTASTRRIGARAGLDAALIGRTCGSKLSLWLAVLDGIAQKILPLLDKLEGSLSMQVVSAAVDDLVALVCDGPQLATLLIAEVIHPNERTEHIVARVIEPILQGIRGVIVAAHVHDRLADEELQLRAFAILGSLAVVAASRPVIAHSLAVAGNEARFRSVLKSTVMAQIESWSPLQSEEGQSESDAPETGLR